MDDESNSDERIDMENDKSRNDRKSELSLDLALKIDSFFSASELDVRNANLGDGDYVPGLHRSTEDEENEANYEDSDSEDDVNDDTGDV